MKYDFPTPKHFDQIVDQYCGCFDATFLAYPSDRVGEALYIGKNNPMKKLV